MIAIIQIFRIHYCKVKWLKPHLICALFGLAVKEVQMCPLNRWGTTKQVGNYEC